MFQKFYKVVAMLAMKLKTGVKMQIQLSASIRVDFKEINTIFIA